QVGLLLGGGSGGLALTEVERIEQQGRGSAPEQVCDEVDPEVRERGKAHQDEADGHSRIEGPAGNSADGVGSDHHGEADGEAVVRVPLVILGRGYVQDDEDERESEEE